MHVPPVRAWSTADVGPAERFAYWNDAVCAAYLPLETTTAGGAPFSGSVAVHRWPGLDVSRVAATPHHVRRRRGQDSDDCLVSFQVRGRAVIDQHGRTAALTEGTLALYDGGAAYDLHFEHAFEQVVVQFPRDGLVARGLDPRAVAAHRCEGGMARVAAALAVSTLDNAGDLSAAQRGALSGQLLDCLASALAGRTGAEVDAQARRSAQRHAVLALAHEHLLDPALSVEHLARALHRSPRSLQRLFSDQPHGLGELLRRARVDRAARALVDPARAHHTVARVAADHGFADAAHFARAFRERHGCSPSEHRSAGAAGAVSRIGRGPVGPVLAPAPATGVDSQETPT